MREKREGKESQRNIICTKDNTIQGMGGNVTQNVMQMKWESRMTTEESEEDGERGGYDKEGENAQGRGCKEVAEGSSGVV